MSVVNDPSSNPGQVRAALTHFVNAPDPDLAQIRQQGIEQLEALKAKDASLEPKTVASQPPTQDTPVHEMPARKMV